MATAPAPVLPPTHGPLAAHADMIKQILMVGVARVSGYVAYFHPSHEWWCAEVTVPTQRPRSLRISKTVIDSPDTDWHRLGRALAELAKAEFQADAGCVVSVQNDAARKGQFTISVGRPYSEDLRPRELARAR